MQFPNIPTDNLYKFMAITGLITIILSFASLFYSLNKLMNDQMDLLKNSALSNIDLKYQVNDMYQWSKLADFHISKIPDSIIQSNDYKKIEWYVGDDDTVRISLLEIDYFLESGMITDQSLFALLKTERKIIQNYIDTEKNRVIAKSTRKKLNRRMVFSAFHFFLSVLFTIYGFNLTVKGFRFWYDRHQKYQDMIIKNESEKINE